MFQQFLNELAQTKTGKLIFSAANAVEGFLNGERGPNERDKEKQEGSFLSRLVHSPMTLLYYFYIWLPLFWCTLTWKYFILILRVSARRSPQVGNLMRHILAFYSADLNHSLVVISLYEHVRGSRPVDIVNWILQTCFEVVYTALNGTSVEFDKDTEEADCAELILYQEFEELNPLPASYRKRMKRIMHYDVSTNPFYASVRLPTHSRGQTPLRTRANTDWSEAGTTTPGSFPPSPNLRQYVLGKSTDKVENVIYIARDKLRLEARKSHSDEFTKRSASKLIGKGKFGTFDPFHTAQNIRLSNGNHCAKRISLTQRTSPPAEIAPSPISHPLPACSTRSAIPVMRNVYVYVEYYIKSNRSPSLTMTSNQLKVMLTPTNSMSVQPPLGQIDGQDQISDHNPILPPPSPSPHSPSKKINGDGPGVFLGLASCEFEMQSEAPVGLFDKSVSISGNGYVNISGCNTVDDSEHGHTSQNEALYVPKSFPIQGHISSGDRVGLLLYLPSSSRDADGLFTPDISTSRDSIDGPTQACSSDSWSSLSMKSLENTMLPNLSHLLSASTSLDQHGTTELESFEIIFSLNGYPIELSWDAQTHLSEISWGDSPLYPTVSFLDEGTNVWGGFCVDDVHYRDRKSIGAPSGVIVYCLDGSVLLQSDE